MSQDRDNFFKAGIPAYRSERVKVEFSKKVPAVAVSDLRRSIVFLYLGKWSRFLHWC